MNVIESCPECKSQVFHAEGCLMCPACGWSACSFGLKGEAEEAEKVLEHKGGELR